EPLRNFIPEGLHRRFGTSVATFETRQHLPTSELVFGKDLRPLKIQLATHERSDVVECILCTTAQYWIVEQSFEAIDYIDTHCLMNSSDVTHASYSQSPNLIVNFRRNLTEQYDFNRPTVWIVIRQRQQGPGG
ncbi:hypothetical protein ACFXPV_12905, partial [Streptomyces sp. NPDC059118]|uniref:hypothetical protein n=1 Tax=Streptomyces sp. NPDC059118 TaxID=3346731 RepID=UPI0036B65664